MQIVPVTVVIPCYRCAETIHRSINSIWKQTYRPDEVVLIEDYSNDNNKTIDTINDIKSIYPEGWIIVKQLKENKGPGVARNVGWEIAKNPYIAFLDADDTWHFQKIEIQYTFMDNNQNTVMTGHNFAYVKNKEANKLKCIESTYSDYKINALKILVKNEFSTPSVMLKKSLPYRFSDKKYSEDYLLWSVIIFKEKEVRKIDLSLAFVHKKPFGDSGLSSSLWKMEKGELNSLKVLKDMKLINSFIYVLFSSFSLLKFLFRIGKVSLDKFKKW